MKHTLLIVFTLLLSLSFSASYAACGSGQAQVIVSIVPDNYPTETSWSLYNDITHTLIDTGTTNSDTLCVPSNTCLKFTIYDVYGDGICCNYGQGSYNVYLNGARVASGGVFGHSEITYFNCPAGHDCSHPVNAVVDTMVAPQPDTWYAFTTDSTGMYYFSTCDLGNTCDTKIYIYDHCNGLVPTEDNQGTTFYSDDGCANYQSYISAAMGANQTFYIRIGDYNTSCAGDSIRWSITYGGPVVGCMDPNSCSYNPLATVSDTTQCVYPPSPLCPAPDLEVDYGMLVSSMHLDHLTVTQNNCYINEGCLAGYGVRNLIRFSTHIINVGDMDYYIGAPDTVGGQFIWDPCHQHWHYAGYAEYLLFDQNHQQVQVGFKNGFCVLDLECNEGGIGKYSCGDMGITAGCGDIYDSGLDCQWIDITDVDTGYYTLVVRVNWDHSPDKLGHYEKSYNNNWAQVCLHLEYDSLNNKTYDVIANCPAYVDCAGDTFGSAQMDCANTCNGSAVRGDLNVSLARDTTDMLLYLGGITDENLAVTSCNDLNADGRISVTDAARLNGCLRHLAGTLTNYTNAQTAQHLCEFPYNIFNPLDTTKFSIANVDWVNHYFDVSIYNPAVKIMGYELKITGVTIDSVKNLALGNYQPDIRFSAITGHITELSNEDQALYRQLAPLNFLRVYFSNLVDSTICLASVPDVVNENYEQVIGSVINGCATKHATQVGIEELMTDNDLSVIPNPSTGLFNVYLANRALTGADIAVYDVTGKRIYQQQNSLTLSNNLALDLGNEASGLYLLQINVLGVTISRRLLLVKQ